MSTTFPVIESFEKRFFPAFIRFDSEDPIRDIFIGIGAGWDDLTDEIKDALNDLNPNKAAGDALSILGKKVGVLREPGEIDAEYRKRILVALPAKLRAGTLFAINLVVLQVAGQVPTITRQDPNQGMLIEDSDFYVNFQDYQDNGLGCILDDEADFSDTQDHQDNSTSDCVIFDEGGVNDPFFIKVAFNSGSFDNAALTKFLLSLRAGRDIMEIEIT